MLNRLIPFFWTYIQYYQLRKCTVIQGLLWKLVLYTVLAPDFLQLIQPIDLNSWQANGYVAKSKHLYFLPKYCFSCLFAPVCVGYNGHWCFLPVAATLCRVCWCAPREHVVPSIIDGQGQRARQRCSTQPECHKARQSDRATHTTSLLSFHLILMSHSSVLRVMSGNR